MTSRSDASAPQQHLLPHPNRPRPSQTLAEAVLQTGAKTGRNRAIAPLFKNTALFSQSLSERRARGGAVVCLTTGAGVMPLLGNVQNSETALCRLVRSLQEDSGARLGSFTVCAAAHVPGAPGLRVRAVPEQEPGSQGY